MKNSFATETESGRWSGVQMQKVEGVFSQCPHLSESRKGRICESEPGGVWVADMNGREVTKEIWKDHQITRTFLCPQSMLL